MWSLQTIVRNSIISTHTHLKFLISESKLKHGVPWTVMEGAQGHFKVLIITFLYQNISSFEQRFPGETSSSHSPTFYYPRRENAEQDEVGGEGGGEGQTDMCFNKTTHKHEKKKERTCFAKLNLSRPHPQTHRQTQTLYVCVCVSVSLKIRTF